jgi:hypothetical protein
MRTTSVLPFLLAGYAFTAAAQPLLSPVPLTNTRYSTSGRTTGGMVAVNGRTAVALWTTSADVRVSRLGGATATIGVPIGVGRIRDAGITAHGSGFVAAVPGGIRFLDAEGRPLGELISIGEINEPRLVSNGSRIMLASTDPQVGYQIIATIIDSAGQVVQKGVTVGTQHDAGGPFAVASDGAGFAVASTDATGVRVTILDAAGNITSTVTLEGTQDERAATRFPGIASDGHGYVVVWPSVDQSLRAARVGVDGAIASTAVVTPPHHAFRHFTEAALAFDGHEYVCAYVDYGDPQLVRIEPSTLQATAPFPLAAVAVNSRVSIAAANGTAYATWMQRPRMLVGRSIAADGSLGEIERLSAGAQDQSHVAATSNGLDTLVTWVEENGEGATLMAGLIAADGAWHELGPLPFAGSTRQPLVASNGHDFLVVSGVKAVRISSGGEILDRPAIDVRPLIASSVVWGGRDYVLAGEIYPNGVAISPGLGALGISPAGVVGALHNIRPPAGGDRAELPSIASSGSDFLVTYTWWEPGCNCPFPAIIGSGARALRLSSSLDAMGTEIKTYPASAVTSTPLAWNGTIYLGVSVDYFLVDAVRIAPDGTLLGRTRLNPNAELKRIGTPSVVARGSDFLVTWREVGLLGPTPGKSFMATVRGDGTYTAPQVVDLDALSTTDPIVVAKGGGEALIISSRFIAEAPYFGAERLIIRHIANVSLPQPPSLAIRLNGAGALLTWTPAPGAAGYRLESRRSDGDWEELEAWFPSSARSTSLQIAPGGSFRFRLKAIGLGGAAYSNIVSTDVPRRRAAR